MLNIIHNSYAGLKPNDLVFSSIKWGYIGQTNKQKRGDVRK